MQIRVWATDPKMSFLTNVTCRAKTSPRDNLKPTIYTFTQFTQKGAMEIDYDIYGDLPNIDVSTCEEIEKLRQQNIQLEEHIKSLEADVEKLCGRIAEMKKTQDNLSRNISELYKTAKAEIERKDRTIADLRGQVEKLQLERRNHMMGVKRERSVSSCRSSSDCVSKKIKMDEYMRRNRKSPSSHRRSRSRSKERHRQPHIETRKTHDKISKVVKVESKIVQREDERKQKVCPDSANKVELVPKVKVSYKELKSFTIPKLAVPKVNREHSFQARLQPTNTRFDKSGYNYKKNTESVGGSSKVVPTKDNLKEPRKQPAKNYCTQTVNEESKKMITYVIDDKVNFSKREGNIEKRLENEKNSDTFKEKQRPPFEKSDSEENNQKHLKNRGVDEKNSDTVKEKQHHQLLTVDEKNSGTVKEKQQPPSQRNEKQSEKKVDEKNSVEEKRQPPCDKNEKQSQNKLVDEKNSHTSEEKQQQPDEKNEKQAENKVVDEKNSDTFEERRQPPCDKNEKQSQNKVVDEKNSGTSEEKQQRPGEKNEKQLENKVDEKNSGTFEERQQRPCEKDEKQSEKVVDEKNSGTFEENRQPSCEKNKNESENKVEKNSGTFEERQQRPCEKDEKQSEKVVDEKNSGTCEEKRQPPREKNKKESENKVEKNSGTFEEEQSENKVVNEKNSDTFEEKQQPLCEKNEKQLENKVVEKNSDTFEEKQLLPTEKNQEETSEKQLGHEVISDKNGNTCEEKQQPLFENYEKQLEKKTSDTVKEKSPKIATQTVKKKTNKPKIEDVTIKLKQKLDEDAKLNLTVQNEDKKVVESKENKTDEQKSKKQPDPKPKKVKKDKCDEEIKESGRILRSATRRNSSREKLDKKEQETSPSIILSDLESIDSVSLTHEGEIPVLHISDNESSPNNSSRTLFDLNTSQALSSSPKTVDMQLLREDLNISLDQSPIKPSVPSPNTSSARKRRRYHVSLI